MLKDEWKSSWHDLYTGCSSMLAYRQEKIYIVNLIGKKCDCDTDVFIATSNIEDKR